MCLAEALLRIPDAATADQLIADKLGGATGKRTSATSESLFVNASTWALLLTGRIVRVAADVRRPGDVPRAPRRAARRARRPRRAAPGDEDPRPAVRDGRDDRRGAAARARGSARDYRLLVRHARRGGAHARRRRALSRGLPRRDRRDRPRGEPAAPLASGAEHLGQAVGAAPALRARAGRGASGRARAARCSSARAQPRARPASALTVDAEEADRLELSLRSSTRCCDEPTLARLGRARARGAGLSEARAARARLARDARAGGRAAGASRCGWSRARTGTPRSSARRSAASTAIPVFTRKANTDVPTSRARATAARARAPSIRSSRRTTRTRVACDRSRSAATRPFEFQRLHGMGEELYAALLARPGVDAALPRLRAGRQPRAPAAVSRAPAARERREHVVRESPRATRTPPAETIVEDPVAARARSSDVAHPRIPLPRDLFAPAARATRAARISPTAASSPPRRRRSPRRARGAAGAPGRDRRRRGARGSAAREPQPRGSAARRRHRGCADAAAATRALDARERVPARLERDAAPSARAALLCARRRSLRARDAPTLVARCVARDRPHDPRQPRRGARGRGSAALLRGAVRRSVRARGSACPGPTGERNELQLAAAACSSASARGISRSRSSRARSRRRSPRATRVDREARRAEAARRRTRGATAARGRRARRARCSSCPATARMLGEALLPDPRVAGVVFTGSVETAQAINRALAARDGGRSRR